MTEVQRFGYSAAQQHSPPTGLSTGKPKTNRLSRSFRLSQKPRPPLTDVDPSSSRHTEFKTPTRVPRPRYSCGFSGESPLNDSELQQDIIWDATSPTPVKAGRRCKKQTTNTGIVDISEIVERIAPKHGRPQVPEPTLQEWIGDSAAIPCTPDVQQPKVKRKSPRPSGVDDLLKLAKQFDFNMFGRDEKEIEDTHQKSLELLSDDIFDFESSIENEPPYVPPEVTTNAIGVGDPQVQLAHDHNTDDELDLIFDGPTQQISGNISQCSLDARPPLLPSKQASGSLHCPISNTPSTHVKGTTTNIDFEDDWENDDFMNCSSVFEMTQSVEHLAPPKYCSTQSGSHEIPSQKSKPSNISTGVTFIPQAENRGGQSAVPKGNWENGKQRQTFSLGANPNFPPNRILAEVSTNQKSAMDNVTPAPYKNTQRSTFPSSKGLAVEAGSQHNWQVHHKAVKTVPQATAAPQRTPLFNSCTEYSLSTSATSSSTAAAKSHPLRPSHTETTSNCKPSEQKEQPGRPDPLDDGEFFDEDLDSLFASEPAWDDPEDDDLLCEMCDDLESQVQSLEASTSHQQGPPVAKQTESQNQPAGCSPFGRGLGTMDRKTVTEQFKQQGGGPTSSWSGAGRGGSWAKPLSNSTTPAPVACTSRSAVGGISHNHSLSVQSDAGKEPCRYMQAGSTWNTGVSVYPQRGGMHSAAGSAAPGNAPRGQSQFTFKKPLEPATAPAIKAPVKCSAAEIELKKLQAMERRRQRMQDTQNRRPT